MENDSLIKPEELIKTAPLKLSVSRTKVWSACKKQYEFNYILHFERKERDYHAFGHLLHKALEVFHQLYIKGWLLPANEAMKVAFQTAKAEFGSKLSASAIKEAHEILSKYLKLVSDKPNLLKNVLATEEPFSLPLTESVLLNGFIDKVAIDDDGVIHISDYKTTKDKRYLKNDWFQLMTYAYVMFNQRPDLSWVRVSYVMLRHNFEHISRDVSREDVEEEVKQQYINYARDIESAEEYPANPTRLCSSCDFLEHCTNGQEFIGKKEVRHGEIDY